MANEITVGGSLTYAKNKARASLSGAFSATQIGDKYSAGVQIVGTTEEQLAKNDVGTIGYVGVRNMDTTNFVQFGSATGAYSLKVLPGEFAVVPWKHAAVYALADTANVEVEYLLIEA